MKLLDEMVKVINSHIRNKETSADIANELLDLIRSKDISEIIE